MNHKVLLLSIKVKNRDILTYIKDSNLACLSAYRLTPLGFPDYSKLTESKKENIPSFDSSYRIPLQ